MSLLEGRTQIVRIPKLQLINHERPRNKNSFGFDPIELKKHPHTETAFKLLINLFGNNHAERPAIIVNLLDPLGNYSKQVPLDYIDFNDSSCQARLRMYCNEDGYMSFALVSNDSRVKLAHGFRPKLDSLHDNRADAAITGETLRQFVAHMGVKDIEVSGPTDNEHYVVVTRANPGEAIAKSGNKDIFGLVLSPNIGRSVHGDISLLVRENKS
jgi:hypothetical protein